MSTPASFLNYVDENIDEFIRRLGNAIAIPSVSCNPDHWQNVLQMAEFLETELKGVGCNVTSISLNRQKLKGMELNFPPVLLADIGNDPSKMTILCYGHFDVYPALKEDGWDTDPFTLVEKNGEMVGRGVTDDHHRNYFFLVSNYQGVEEIEFTDLNELIGGENRYGDFFKDVAAVCISDSCWLDTRTPCLIYGLSGLSSYELTVYDDSSSDLCSGISSSTIHDPRADLGLLLSTLTDEKGNILVEGFNELVVPYTWLEKKHNETLDYSVGDVEGAVLSGGQGNDRIRMRLPSMSTPNISESVTPGAVTGMFSIRLVPDQTTFTVNTLVQSHFEREFKKLNTKNRMCLKMNCDREPWMSDPSHWNFKAAEKAIKENIYQEIYGNGPNIYGSEAAPMEGAPIPEVRSFIKDLGVNVLLLPMGRFGGGAHSVNEKLDRSDFLKGTKVFGAYLYALGSTKT